MIPRIAERITGATIVKVVARGAASFGGEEGDGDTPSDIYTPNGGVFLKLDNGLIIRAWNSEWGGLTVLDRQDCNDCRDIEFVDTESA